MRVGRKRGARIFENERERVSVSELTEDVVVEFSEQV